VVKRITAFISFSLTLVLAWQIFLSGKSGLFTSWKRSLVAGLGAGFCFYGGYLFPGPLEHIIRLGEKYPAEGFFAAGLLILVLGVLTDGGNNRRKLYGLLALLFLSAGAVGGSLAIHAAQSGLELGIVWRLGFGLGLGVLVSGLGLLGLPQRLTQGGRAGSIASPLRSAGALLLVMGILTPAIEKISLDIFQPFLLPSVPAPMAWGLLLAVFSFLLLGYRATGKGRIHSKRRG